MRTITTAIALSAILGVPTAHAAGAGNYVLVEKFYSIYYPAPDAWSCKDKKGCVECENISADLTLVLLSLQPSGTSVQHNVPAGSSVKTCGDVLYVSGDVPVL